MKYLEITRFPPLEYASNEAMNTLCTNLSYCGTDVRTVMTTSRYAVEGKSYVSMNLMRSLASLGRRVVLVDTDLRCSGIQKQFRLRYPEAKNEGLSDYLAGLCDMPDILYATNLTGAYLIPSGHEVANSLPLLNSPRMAALMASMAERFDMVLVDTPPAGILVDAMEIAKYCDGALIVVSYNRGKRRDIREVKQIIEKTGCRVLGAVLNGVEFRTYANRKYFFNSERYESYYSKGYAARYGRKKHRESVQKP